MPTFRAGDRVRLTANLMNRLSAMAGQPDGRMQGINYGAADSGTIWVKNDTGLFVPSHGILGLGDSLFDPMADEDAFHYGAIVIKGETPTPEDHADRFCVVQQSLDANEVGRAWITGVVAVIVNMTDADHGYATLDGESAGTPTEAFLSAPYGPVRIVWVETGTGEKLALVELRRAAYLPPFFEATAAEEGGTITAKTLSSAGVLEGPELTFTVPPESE